MRALAISFILSVLALPAWSADPIVGSIKTVSGTATVRRGQQTLSATTGMHLLPNDILQTGADGRLGAILQDGTGLGLGPGTELKIDTFLFEPADGKFGLLLRMARGVLAYFSGRIAKFAPGSVTLETPVGVIGLRGTHFAVSLGGA